MAQKNWLAFSPKCAKLAQFALSRLDNHREDFPRPAADRDGHGSAADSTVFDEVEGSALGRDLNRKFLPALGAGD